MKRSKAIPVLVIFFTALLLLLIVSYLLVPFWATKLVEVILQDTHVHIDQGEFSRPGLTGLEVTNLGITYRSDADVYTFHTQKLAINYSLASLFNGELLAVSSELVDVHHEQTQPPESSPSAPLQSFPLLLPSEVFKRIPVKRVAFKMLTITSPLLSDFGRLTGQLSFNQQAFEVGFSSARQRNFTFNFRVNRDNKVDLNLTENGQLIATISSENEPEGVLNIIKTWAKVDLERTSLLAKKMGWLRKEITVSGDLDAQWRMQLPDSINEEMIKMSTMTGEVSSTGKLEHLIEKIDSDYSLAATFKLSAQAVVVKMGRLNVSGSLPAGENIVDVLPAVKAACSKSRDCFKFIIKASPDTEFFIDSKNKVLLTKKGEFMATVGINQAINKSAKAAGQTKGLLGQAQLKALRYQWADDWQLKGNYEASLAIHSLALAEVQTEHISGQVAGNLVVSPEAINLHVKSGSHLLDVQNVQISDGLIPSLVIHNSNDLDVTIAEGKVDFSNVDFDLKAPDFTWDNQLFRMQAGLIIFKKSSIDLDNPRKNSVLAEAVLSGLGANKVTMRLVPISLNANMILSGSLITGKYHTQEQTGIVRIEGEFKHELHTSRGKMDANLQPITFREDRIYLPKLLENWQYPLDLLAGTISVSTRFAWDDSQVANETEISLKDVGVFYDRNLVNKINGLIRLDGPMDGMRIQRQTLTVASINAGVDIKNIEFTIQGTLDALVIENLQAELLGGKVSQKIMIYRQGDPENKINLRLDAIQLSEILKLQPGVTGDGQLNGDLPLRLFGSDVEMNMGKIVSDSSGVIRYQADSPVPGAVSNSGVKLALDALNNFHYDVMEIDADYAITGDLLLKARLEGRNPDLKIKRPFHFNLQVRQNIPALMKSLQLTQEISDSIDIRVKNFYQGRK